MFDLKIASLSPSLLAFSLLLLFLAPFGAVAATTSSETIATTSIGTSVNHNDPPPLIDCNEINREITLGEMGRVHLSDSYYITSKVENLDTIKICLPQGACNVSANDAMGSLRVVSEEKNETTYTNATITLRITLKEGEAGRFTVAYHLPRESYVDQYSWCDFNLTFTFFERFNWTIRRLTVSVILPAGAEYVSSSVQTPRYSEGRKIQKGTFQETVIFALDNVTRFDDLGFTVAYRYLIFWASFHPTLWMGVLVAIVCTVALLRRAPKPLVSVVPLPSEVIRRFAGAYEDKTRILLELKSMEQRVRKGRIPRRRYKVQRKTLEGRLSVLSRDLTDLREEIRAAGPRYADVMGRIEVAETELEGVEEDIRRVETRYRRRELSSEAYRKLLEEYRRRKERAETTLDGLLLRLREEIR